MPYLRFFLARLSGQSLAFYAGLLSPSKKLNLAVYCAASLFFLIVGTMKPKQGRKPEQLFMILAGLVGLLFTGCEFYWYTNAGLLRTHAAATAFLLGWHFLGGIFLALLIPILYHKRAIVLFGLAFAMFILFNVSAVWLYSIKCFAPACVFSSTGFGWLLGTLVAWAVLFRPERKRDDTPTVAV